MRRPCVFRCFLDGWVEPSSAPTLARKCPLAPLVESSTAAFLASNLTSPLQRARAEQPRPLGPSRSRDGGENVSH